VLVNDNDFNTDLHSGTCAST